MSNIPGSPPQLSLFPPDVERALAQIPALGDQGDIRYFATRARSVLNGPAATGMSFWSVNPYVGCAFGQLDRSARLRYLPFIEREFPELAGRYNASYTGSRNVSEKYRLGLARFFDELCRKYNVRNWSREERDGM